jgi:hypothetical protein
VLAAQDTLATGLMGVSPLVGSGSVPQQVADGAKTGDLMRVPVLMGGAQDELRLYVAYFKLFAPFASDYSEAKLRSFWLPNFYGQDAPDPNAPGLAALFGARRHRDARRSGQGWDVRRACVPLLRVLECTVSLTQATGEAKGSHSPLH